MDARQAGDQPTPAGRRTWLGMLVLAVPCLLYSMDLTILNLALPHIEQALQPDPTELLWIVDAYGFVLAGALIPMGALGDRIGRRRLLMAGAASFGAASVLAALASSPDVLIVVRATLGLAAATLAPSTLSLIRGMFAREDQRNLAIAIWGASFAVGGALGPVLGGVLLGSLGWQAAFLVAVPPMLLLLVAAPSLLPEGRGERSALPDLPAAVLATASILAAVYGIKRFAVGGPDPGALVGLAAAVVLAQLFVARQRRLEEPLIDARLLDIPGVRLSLSVTAVVMFATFGTMLLSAHYLQLVAGLPPLEAGLLMLPSGASSLAGSLLVPVVLRRTAPSMSMAIGVVVMAASFAMLLGVTGPDDLAVAIMSSVALTLGGCLAGIAATTVMVSAVPAARTGAATGLSQTSSELGGALGIAILGSIATALYRAEAQPALASVLSPGAASVAAETLGGTVGAAAGLPSDLATTVITVAQRAFATGLHGVAVINLLAMLGLALAMGRTMSRRSASLRPTDDVSRTREPAMAQKSIIEKLRINDGASVWI